MTYKIQKKLHKSIFKFIKNACQYFQQYFNHISKALEAIFPCI